MICDGVIYYSKFAKDHTVFVIKLCNDPISKYAYLY